MNYNIGDEIQIKDAKVYGFYDKRSDFIIKSGTFYIYNDKIRNSRIMITDDMQKINKPCMATGWIDLTSIQ